MSRSVGGTPGELELVVEALPDHAPTSAGETVGLVDDTRERRPVVVATALILVVLAAAGLGLVRRDGKPARVVPSPPTTARYELPPVMPGVIRPTMVAPTMTPQQMRLVEGASLRSPSPGNAALIAWSFTKKQAIEAAIVDQGCTGARFADRDDAAAAARQSVATDARWCESGTTISVIAGPTTDAEAFARVVESVQIVHGAPTSLRLSGDAPDGLSVLPSQPTGERVALRYASPDGTAAVRIVMMGSDEHEVGRSAARALLYGKPLEQPRMMGDFVGYISGSPWPRALAGYDDHTAIFITATGTVTTADLETLIESLAPAPDALAPPLEAGELDPSVLDAPESRCRRFELC